MVDRAQALRALSGEWSVRQGRLDVPCQPLCGSRCGEPRAGLVAAGVANPPEAINRQDVDTVADMFLDRGSGVAGNFCSDVVALPSASGQRWARRHDARKTRAVSEVQHSAVEVVEVADGRDAGVGMQRRRADSTRTQDVQVHPVEGLASVIFGRR